MQHQKQQYVITMTILLGCKNNLNLHSIMSCYVLLN